MRSAAQILKGQQNLVFVLGLSESIDQLAIANSVCWYAHVLIRALD